jgi:hypothetical protein
MLPAWISPGLVMLGFLLVLVLCGAIAQGCIPPLFGEDHFLEAFSYLPWLVIGDSTEDRVNQNNCCSSSLTIKGDRSPPRYRVQEVFNRLLLETTIHRRFSRRIKRLLSRRWSEIIRKYNSPNFNQVVCCGFLPQARQLKGIP